jgi:hypothetical protein
MAIHLFIKFACENREFQIQLTKQASLNLEKENVPQGEQGREKGFLFTRKGDYVFRREPEKAESYTQTTHTRTHFSIIYLFHV